MPRTVHHL